MGKKYKQGDYIPLNFDNTLQPEFHLVFGWVHDAEFARIVERETGLSDILKIARIYGRWSMESGPDGPGQTFRDYDSPGRGRWECTIGTIREEKKP